VIVNRVPDREEERWAKLPPEKMPSGVLTRDMGIKNGRRQGGAHKKEKPGGLRGMVRGETQSSPRGGLLHRAGPGLRGGSNGVGVGICDPTAFPHMRESAGIRVGFLGHGSRHGPSTRRVVARL